MKAVIFILALIVSCASAVPLSQMHTGAAQLGADSMMSSMVLRQQQERAAVEATHEMVQQVNVAQLLGHGLKGTARVQHRLNNAEKIVSTLVADTQGLEAIRAAVATASKDKVYATGFGDVYAGTGNFCWLGSKWRGVGTIPDLCLPSEEKIGLLCYDKCPSTSTDCSGKTMVSAGFGCREKCAAGQDETPLVCFGKGWDFFTATTSRCGYERPPKGNKCEAGKTDQAGLCYEACPAGASAFGPVCWQTCPSGFEQCGPFACSKNKGACIQSVSGMVSKTVVSGLSIASLVLSAGASGVPLSAAKTAVATVVKNLGTAKTIVGFTNTAVSAAITAYINRSDISSAIKSALTAMKDKIDSWIDQFAEFALRIALADDGFIAEASKAKENLPEEPSLSTLTKLKEWFNKPENKEKVVKGLIDFAITIAGAIDPTGILSVIQAFAHPICK